MVIKTIRMSTVEEVELAYRKNAKKRPVNIRRPLPSDIQEIKRIIERLGSVTIEIEGNNAALEAFSKQQELIGYHAHPDAGVLAETHILCLEELFKTNSAKLILTKGKEG